VFTSTVEVQEVVLASSSFISLSQEENLLLANHLGLYMLLMDPSNH
jgi:hypothetical protein